MKIKKLSKILSALQGLVGREINAFGKDSRGCWGRSETIKTYKIKDFSYEDGLLNVYLENYKVSEDEDNFIYTDPRFAKELKALFKEAGIPSNIDYSEQGMQGDDFVNFDCDFED